MAEGGCVTTNNKVLSEKIRRKLNHDIIRKKNIMKVSKKFLDPWFYEINELGYNYRASEINCALGLSQLKRLTASIKLRNKIALTYKRELESIDLIKFPISLLIKNTMPGIYLLYLLILKKRVLVKEILLIGLSRMG